MEKFYCPNRRKGKIKLDDYGLLRDGSGNNRACWACIDLTAQENDILGF